MADEDESGIDKVTEDIHEHAHTAKERWVSHGVTITAILLAVFGALANCISAHDESHGVLEQIQASDQWAYYQAKGIKMELQEQRADILDNFGKKIEADKAREQARGYSYEQYKIKREATDLQDESKKHMKVHAIYAYGVVFFQVAIAVSGIAALTRRKQLWHAGLFFGFVGLCFIILGLLI